MRLFRFIKALWKYFLYGKRVDYDTFVNRLIICNYCDKLDRDKWSCKECGCYLTKKCKMNTEKCPNGKW